MIVSDLTDVLQVFDVIPFCAHDLIDDVGPHLFFAGQARSEEQPNTGALLLLSLLQLCQVILHRLILVHTQLREDSQGQVGSNKAFQTKKSLAFWEML